MSPEELRLLANFPLLAAIMVGLWWVVQRLIKIEGRVIRLETKLDSMKDDITCRWISHAPSSRL
jgi:hypothetical protein